MLRMLLYVCSSIFASSGHLLKNTVAILSLSYKLGCLLLKNDLFFMEKPISCGISHLTMDAIKTRRINVTGLKWDIVQSPINTICLVLKGCKIQTNRRNLELGQRSEKPFSFICVSILTCLDTG